jgi:hypothetical protein
MGASATAAGAALTRAAGWRDGRRTGGIRE